MKKMLMTAAIALTAGSAVYAETNMLERDNLIRTRDITGGNVYAVEANDWGMDKAYDGVDENWDVIGEIEDIVLDKNGQMIGIIAEVGGFLDIGDKHVFIETQSTRLIPVDDKTYGYVSPLNKDQLMAKENLDEGFWD